MSEAPLAIVGNLNADLWVSPVERFPRWDEEVVVRSARLALAGTAGYVVLACRGLGIETVTVSTVGDDVFGRFVLSELERLGARADCVEVLEGWETSLGMVFVGGDGRRSILSTLGAHERMGLEVVERHDAEIASCREVFVCGSYLLPHLSPSSVLPCARRARARGQVTVFDPSWDPSGWGERTRRTTYELLHEVDVYLPNEEELTRLTGRSSWREALEEVRGMAGEVVLKRGAEGAVYASGSELVEVPGFRVEAVNTIGAGDVFDAGYLYARRMGWPPERRLELASALAAIVISQAAERAYPDPATVLEFVDRNRGNRSRAH